MDMDEIGQKLGAIGMKVGKEQFEREQNFYSPLINPMVPNKKIPGVRVVRNG